MPRGFRRRAAVARASSRLVSVHRCSGNVWRCLLGFPSSKERDQLGITSTGGFHPMRRKRKASIRSRSQGIPSHRCGMAGMQIGSKLVPSPGVVLRPARPSC